MGESGSLFGEFLREQRVLKKLTLRRFCEVNEFDPSNVSKIERGVWPPPESEADREKYAKALGLKKGSGNWQKLMDLADADSGEFKVKHITDQNVLQKLPVLFRTLDNKELTEEKLDEIINIVRKA